MKLERSAYRIIVLLLACVAPRARADEGMWLPDRPPLKLLAERHGFSPDRAWLDHLQKSAVKFGASASFVSADGLLMTNHHVGSDAIAKLSTKERDLMRDGFYAPDRAAELKCAGLEARVLWSIEDVSERIERAAAADMTPTAAFQARRAEMTRIEAESREKTGLDSQVVTLYHGARFHLYRYRRYADVRLVFAPEKAIAFFGGDTDNFEYPRFDFDVCFFRVYDEQGRPLRPEHFLRWSAAGASDGALTIVAGHPGRTQRLYTVDHLKFLRDLELPFALRMLWRRESQLATFRGRSEDHARIAEDDFFGVQNSRKAQTGGLSALLDPSLVVGKQAAEGELRAAVRSRPEQQSKWGDAWERLREAQERYRSFYTRWQLLRERRGIDSELFRYARTLLRMATELPKPSTERLREYRDSELDSVRLQLFSAVPIYENYEIERLASGLQLWAELLGAEDPLVAAALDGRSPRARAEQLVRGCKLADVELRRRLAEGGAAAVEAVGDPMIEFARLIDAETRALRKRYEDEMESVERDSYARIAAAQFALYGEERYPDATGTLRLSFGPIRGYDEDGRSVPAFTTFGGLFEHARERGDRAPFELPARWSAARTKLNPQTPMNFVCTADIIGGNSGSPVVNTRGEVIGLVFDGNIQSLAWGYAFDERQARAVALDSRAIIEALREVYGAKALADELQGGQAEGKPSGSEPRP